MNHGEINIFHLLQAAHIEYFDEIWMACKLLDLIDFVNVTCDLHEELDKTHYLEEALSILHVTDTILQSEINYQHDQTKSTVNSRQSTRVLMHVHWSIS